jgi:hypothetical protein
VYAGSSLRACLLEVLAAFRRDARLAVELDAIIEDDEDALLHPRRHQGRSRGNGFTLALRPQPSWSAPTVP